MNDWKPYNQGRTVGLKSPEGGVILRDEEHPLGVRIILKEAKEYISVSCNIASRIDHSRFFRKMPEAQFEYDAMKTELVKVAKIISSAKSSDVKSWEAIAGFVSKFQ
jgi:hypothetical protein